MSEHPKFVPYHSNNECTRLLLFFFSPIWGQHWDGNPCISIQNNYDYNLKCVKKVLANFSKSSPAKQNGLKWRPDV